MSELVIAQKQDLINIADAIRYKAGTTDGMALDEMAALIAAIESGGGKIASGTIIPANNSMGRRLTITHNLGAIPTFGVIILKDKSLYATTSSGVMSVVFIKGTDNQVFGTQTYLYAYEFTTQVGTQDAASTGSNNIPGANAATDTTITFTAAYSDFNYDDGYEYEWFVGVI